MTTKPEGPAQECPVCLESPCSHFHNAAPATPAPSQPAGAREFLVAFYSYGSVDATGREYTFAHVVEAAEAYARQQTAAKDAELSDANQRVDFQRSQILDLDAAVERQTAIKQAAERERDSLREAIRECLFIAESGKPTDESFTLGVIVAKLQEADAALKAGKDGQMYDIEAISAAVHDAWMENKRKAGVSSRKLESGEELMVPYGQLSEQAKELDRGSVRAVVAAIEQVSRG